MTTQTPLPSLANFHRKIAEEVARPIVIAALGDSVTFGAGIAADDLQSGVYHACLKRLLEERYPLASFHIINAGEGGQNAVGGLQILERAVLPYLPDLVLIGFGLNDAAEGGFAGRAGYAMALEALILRIRHSTQAEIILLTPNMMLRYDNDNIPDGWRHAGQLCMQAQNEGVLSAYAQSVRDVGHVHGVPVADVYAAWEEWEANGVDTTAMLVNGINHPNAAGHALAGQLLFRVIEESKH